MVALIGSFKILVVGAFWLVSDMNQGLCWDFQHPQCTTMFVFFQQIEFPRCAVLPDHLHRKALVRITQR